MINDIISYYEKDIDSLDWLSSTTKEKAKLDDVRDKIIDALVSDYLSKNQEAYIKSMQAVRKEYGMDIVDDDLNTNYTNYIQNSLLKIQESKNSSSSNSSSSK